MLLKAVSIQPSAVSFPRSAIGNQHSSLGNQHSSLANQPLTFLQSSRPMKAARVATDKAES
jgi:hypothetical protein